VLRLPPPVNLINYFLPHLSFHFLILSTRCARKIFPKKIIMVYLAYASCYGKTTKYAIQYRNQRDIAVLDRPEPAVVSAAGSPALRGPQTAATTTEIGQSDDNESGPIQFLKLYQNAGPIHGNLQPNKWRQA
jgi:hypothetical protein